MERRDFIKQTAALASLTAVSGIASANTIGNRPIENDSGRALNCNAGVVLVDERFSDSRRFAEVFASRGAKVISLDEDIGRLWYGELRAHCIHGSGFVAGLTLHTDLFVSKTFARECNKSLVQFGEHDCRGGKALTHALSANVSLDLRACEAWAQEVARAMLDSLPLLPNPLPQGERELRSASVRQASNVARSSDHPGSLYSWSIA